MRKLLTIVLAILIVVGTLNAAHELQTNNQQIKLKEIKLRNIEAELEKLDSDYQTLREDHTKTIEQKQQEIEQLKQREKELQTQLQARQKEKARLAAINTPKVYAAVGSFGGSCESWIAGAGINDVSSARTLIQRESGCNAYAVNKYSGACGVAQELPCGKSGCQLGDGACQVEWMNQYVIGRYGSWANALAHSYSHNWY